MLTAKQRPNHPSPRLSFHAATSNPLSDEQLQDDDAIKIETILPPLLDQMDPSEDVGTLRRIQNAFQRLDEKQSAINESVRANLQELSRKVQVKKETLAAAQELREKSRAQHSAKLAHYEESKFSIAKRIHDEEKAVTSLEARKRELMQELENVKAEELDESSRAPDAAVLKLTLYKGLGIQLIHEGDEIQRCLVRSVNKSDITPITFDPKYSRFYYANTLWEMCSS